MNISDKYKYKEALEDIAEYICESIAVAQTSLKAKDLCDIFNRHDLVIGDLWLKSCNRRLDEQS